MDAIDVSRETRDDLEIYATLLEKWQKSINLVGPDTIPDLWTRHFQDSLQLRAVMPDARRFVDLGSGAGFPGLVLALDLKRTPGAQVTLVESNGKKAAFLRAVIQATQAPAKVIANRLENVIPDLAAPEVVTARALAPLEKLLTWTEPLLKRGAVGLFPKGRGLDQELADAARYWVIDHEVIPSMVDSQSSIVKVRAITAKVALSRGSRP